jgi:hypothetical protein
MYNGVIIVSIVFGSILLIIAMGIFGDVWKSKAKAKALREEQAKEDEQLARLAALEERIEVLERIVTDDKYELKRRFRGL